MTPEEAARIQAGDIVRCDGTRYRVVSVRTGAAWGPYFRLAPLDDTGERPHRRWVLTSYLLCEIADTPQHQPRETGPRLQRSIEPESQTFYRIVESNPPTERDMRSFAALGRRLRDQSPAAQRLARGVSLFDTAAQAATVARETMRKPGAYIATLELPGDAFHIEQSGKPGHYTLFAEPDAILATVTDVRPVADITARK